MSFTHSGEQFYKFGPEIDDQYPDYRENLIFFSDFMINLLKTKEIWTIDGTFSITPTKYFQLYTIGFIENNHCFPVVYALLKDKTISTYKFLFNFIKAKMGEFQPKIVKTGFEYAASTAFKECFSTCQVSAYHFHPGQSVIRRINSLGPKTMHETDIMVKKFTRCLSCLAYIRRGEVLFTFQQLVNHPEFPPCLHPLYDYFKKKIYLF